jgi:FtsH-binding integral membrane protein
VENNQYAPYRHAALVSSVTAEERTAFLKKVYLHLAAAVGLFLVLQTMLQAMPFAERMARTMSNAWLLVILGFWVVGWISSRWTAPGLPISQQYLGLGLFTVAQAIIFMPIIAYIRLYEDPNILPTAGLLTLCLAGGLTLVAMDSRTDFSFLRGALWIVGMVAFGLIISAILFGVALGGWFTLLMIGFASASILYKTDEITKTSRTDGYVSAALALFSSLMLLLWYVLRLLMARR